jgi:hypothetical protein
MKFLLVSLLLVFASSNVFAEEIKKKSEEVNTVNPDDELFYNVSIGVSAFECMLGFEIQKGNHSVGLGLCRQVSYRYYTNPYGDSLLYGLYAGYRSGYLQYETKEEFDGVIYEDKKSMYAGVGVGYRWQWLSGWNVTTSLAIHYMDDEYSNPGQPKKKETSVIPFPGITVGYKF